MMGSCVLVSMLALSPAWGGESGDVIEEVASGVDLNWTTLQLVVVASAQSSGTEDTEAVEQLARRDADAALRMGARRIRLDGSRTVAELDAEPRLGPAVAARLARWTVGEARYYASGKVELVAILSLQDLLKPVTLANARAGGAASNSPGLTGLVVDARETDAKPVWAPRLLTRSGDVLWDGALWESPAVAGVPAVFVFDPADPRAAARAGADPLIVQAADAIGPDLVLAKDDLRRFRSAPDSGGILGQGTLVVVVSP